MLYRLYHRPHGDDSLEECFYFDLKRSPNQETRRKLKWLVRKPLGRVRERSVYPDSSVVEIGPRLAIETAFSSNAVAICVENMEVPVRRVEKSIRYVLAGRRAEDLAADHLDRMTQTIYASPLRKWGFAPDPNPVRYVDILSGGIEALRLVNEELGLGMDEEDMEYYLRLFRDLLKRNPTDVELFQLANANSEHSRHGFFRGRQVINGMLMPWTLMDLVKAPLGANKGNSLLAFNDNSGAAGHRYARILVPRTPGKPSSFVYKRMLVAGTATAETHNHPTGIEPYEGAATGAGGRQRDTVAVGRGGYIRGAVAGYSVGDLGWKTDGTYASPLDIIIKASNGLSNYGNEFGEPLIGGFATSFDMMVNGRRRAPLKPVLYSGAIGLLNNSNLYKRESQIGMRIVRMGGSARRIGVGGGAASSITGGANALKLDFASVQRGDAEMGNRVYRALRAAFEMGIFNPIETLHDQGAGGPSNVLTELVERLGGRVDIRKIIVGDVTMSVLEIWVAEFQEGYGLLVWPKNMKKLRAVCKRERVNLEDLGPVTGDGMIVVEDSKDGTTPVNLPIKEILTDLPPRTYHSTSVPLDLRPFNVPEDRTAWDLLQLVFRLLQVGDKSFLVHKADRSVTGLVARQQCVGPFQVPVANAGVMADSYLGYSGTAEAVSLQQALMIMNPAAAARMAVANLMIKLLSAGISSVADAKCRANWMVAAKEPGEGALMYEAALNLRDVMIELLVAIDGGKDSLSMVRRLPDGPVVAPGTLTLLGYAPVPDFRKGVTPELQGGLIGFIDLGQGKNRLGGSALAQAFGVLGNEAPDIDDADLLKRGLGATHALVGSGRISAYHKRTSGGLITTLSEMCMAGNRGLMVDLGDGDPMPALFSQEAGLVFECSPRDRSRNQELFDRFDVPVRWIGETHDTDRRLVIESSGKEVLSQGMESLRQAWSATSLELEAHQTHPDMVRQEAESLADVRGIPYRLTYEPKPTKKPRVKAPKVAVLREEGTNSDREMTAAFMAAGFEAIDVCMSDLRNGTITSFDSFQVIAFPGGFSYADVFGSGKGWAAGILFNSRIRFMFEAFIKRPDTLTLGVCNGCQLNGWLRELLTGLPNARFVTNRSRKFESRFAATLVLPGPCVYTKGMEGSIIGAHVDHGEGQMLFMDRKVERYVMDHKLAPLAYIDPDGLPALRYPHNPNGSPNGWTALTTPNGRHLSMMPHPERAFLTWQNHYLPEAWRRELKAAPWLQLFQNAYEWCTQHRA